MHRSRFPSISALSVLALGLLASSARAVPRVELGVGFGVGDSGAVGHVTGVTPELTLAIPLNPRMAFVIDWGLTWVSTEAAPPLKVNAIALQDPFIGLELVADADGTLIRFRPGFTLPLAAFTDDPNLQPAQTVAFNMARGTFGMRHLWRYLPENASMVGTIEAEFEPGDAGQVRSWLDTAFAFPTTDDDDDIDMIVEFGLGWSIGPLFVDLSAVWIPTNDGDNAQVALRPGLRFGLFEGGAIELAANLNLDDPFDSFGDSGVIGGDFRFSFPLGGSGDSYDPPPHVPGPSPDPDPDPGPPPSHDPVPAADAFSDTLVAIIEAYPSGFDTIKGSQKKDEGMLASMGTTWVSKRCFPAGDSTRGAPKLAECDVYQGVLQARAKFYAVMLETTNESDATALYDSLVAQVDKTKMPFTKVRLDDKRADSLWSQAYIPFGAGPDYDGIVISVERMMNPVMKVGDRYQKGWSIMLRVEGVPATTPSDDDDDDDDDDGWW